jgi:hypothetical protein
MSDDKIVKRTHVMLRQREIEKLARLQEETGMTTSEIIRVLINDVKRIVVTFK